MDSDSISSHLYNTFQSSFRELWARVCPARTTNCNDQTLHAQYYVLSDLEFYKKEKTTSIRIKKQIRTKKQTPKALLEKSQSKDYLFHPPSHPNIFSSDDLSDVRFYDSFRKLSRLSHKSYKDFIIRRMKKGDFVGKLKANFIGLNACIYILNLYGTETLLKIRRE